MAMVLKNPFAGTGLAIAEAAANAARGAAQKGLPFLAMGIFFGGLTAAAGAQQSPPGKGLGFTPGGAKVSAPAKKPADNAIRKAEAAKRFAIDEAKAMALIRSVDFPSLPKGAKVDAALRERIKAEGLENLYALLKPMVVVTQAILDIMIKDELSNGSDQRYASSKFPQYPWQLEGVRGYFQDLDGVNTSIGINGFLGGYAQRCMDEAMGTTSFARGMSFGGNRNNLHLLGLARDNPLAFAMYCLAQGFDNTGTPPPSLGVLFDDSQSLADNTFGFGVVREEKIRKFRFDYRNNTYIAMFIDQTLLPINPSPSSINQKSVAGGSPRL